MFLFFLVLFLPFSAFLFSLPCPLLSSASCLPLFKYCPVLLFSSFHIVLSVLGVSRLLPSFLSLAPFFASLSLFLVILSSSLFLFLSLFSRFPLSSFCPSSVPRSQLCFFHLSSSCCLFFFSSVFILFLSCHRLSPLPTLSCYQNILMRLSVTEHKILHLRKFTTRRVVWGEENRQSREKERLNRRESSMTNIAARF